MPPLIKVIQRFKLLDIPNKRKEHSTPIPTMGGIASGAGMIISCSLWYQFSRDVFVISFYFSLFILMATGIMDDLRNLSARYKLGIQLAVSLLIAFSGVRITNFSGLFGIYQLPLLAQYSISILAIAGITNAFNLIDGIDGLAGGLGFMSLSILGLFLLISGDFNSAIIAFALGGGLLGFLYYNFNPAKIFMGDTGSLVLGFVISVLCLRLIQVNSGHSNSVIVHSPVFVFSIVAIPVFDTLRVFSIRLWQGRSPFSPDKNHIHHLLTTNGWSHAAVSRILCGLHAILLIAGYLVRNLPQFAGLMVLLLILFLAIWLFRKLKVPEPVHSVSSKPETQLF